MSFANSDCVVLPVIMPAADLRALVKQERHAWVTLDNIQEFLRTYDDQRDKNELQFRMQRLDEVYNKYCEVRVKIEVITDDLDTVEVEGAVGAEGVDDAPVDQAAMAEARQRENEEIFKEFENKYFRLKQQLHTKMIGNQGVIVERQAGAEVCQPSRMKYPELRLPTFTGKHSDWINFRDNFRSLIHTNNQLNMIDKFNYLRSSLKDEALLQINQIQVTAANYTLAWETLEAKYENHKLIAQEHLRALFAVAPMKTESFQGLNHLLTTFRVNLQQLEKLGERPNDWSTLLAFPKGWMTIRFVTGKLTIVQRTFLLISAWWNFWRITVPYCSPRLHEKAVTSSARSSLQWFTLLYRPVETVKSVTVEHIRSNSVGVSGK